MILQLATAINFGDPSPDTGEADGGQHLGIFSAQSGAFTDTRAYDNAYLAVERANNGAAAANQTLAFNVSVWATNTTIKITGINGTMVYCHARRATNVCGGPGGGSSPQGTASAMNILIQNGTNSFVDVGNIIATSTNTMTMTTWNVTGVTNFSQFINSSGFINIQFEFAWNNTGRSAFLNEHTNLTITYDNQPTVTLLSPLNNTQLIGAANVTLICNVTDDISIRNVTLYHNIAAPFTANKTVTGSGLITTAQFNVTNVPPGTYVWNCLASDGITDPAFAAQNSTLTIIDRSPNVTLISPPDGNISNNQNITFIANISDDVALKNATFFINRTGNFVPDQIVQVSGTLNTTSFNASNLEVNTTFLWNILVCDTNNQCSFASQNYTVTVSESQQGGGQQPSPAPTSPPSSSRPSPADPRDTGFDRAALAEQARQSQLPSRSPESAKSLTSEGPESGEPSTSSPPSPPSEQTPKSNVLTGAAVKETTSNKRRLYFIPLLLLLVLGMYILLKKRRKPAHAQQSVQKADHELKSQWAVKHDDYLETKPQKQQAKRLTFYDLYEHFPETYKELRAKGMITLPKKRIETKHDRTLSPSDLKAMFPASLGKVKEGHLRSYTPKAHQPKEPHPILEEIGLHEKVYQIVKHKRVIEEKPSLTPTRKINKLDKPKNKIIEDLKGVYKTG